MSPIVAVALISSTLTASMIFAAASIILVISRMNGANISSRVLSAAVGCFGLTGIALGVILLSLGQQTYMLVPLIFGLGICAYNILWALREWEGADDVEELVADETSQRVITEHESIEQIDPYRIS